MFETKGDVAEWRLLYDRAAQMKVDETIGYAELDVLLGRPFRDDRAPIYKVQREMLGTLSRTLVNVVNVGYRVARADEHAGLGVSRQKRARRQIRAGIRIVKGADRTSLSPRESVRLTAVEMNLADQARMLRLTDQRVAVVEKHQGRQDDRMDLLVAELRRKGIDVDVPSVTGG